MRKLYHRNLFYFNSTPQKHDLTNTDEICIPQTNFQLRKIYPNNPSNMNSVAMAKKYQQGFCTNNYHVNCSNNIYTKLSKAKQL